MNTTYQRPQRNKFSQKTIHRNSILESHGPAGKIRGTLQQIMERYATLGADATREGDTVLAEGFFQHAEHYRRLLQHSPQPAPQQRSPAEHHRAKDQKDPGKESEIKMIPQGDTEDIHHVSEQF